MKVWVKGSNQGVDLSQREFLAAGGEGSVYVRGQTAYKVYHDPAKMIPVGKFQELSAIQDPSVIRPQNLLVDANNTVVGYTMRYVDASHPLCRLFTRAFREREGLTQDHVLDLVAQIQQGTENIHKSGVLVVDGNEQNYLVSTDFKHVFFIDADSYQTKSYRATAIMQSIRDWSVQHNAWTELSDWYSFAVLSCQMFTGIHPFLGKYHGTRPEFRKLPTDDPDDGFAVTRRRMQANISIFHPDVGIPGSAYPLTAIPREYRQWYEALFVQGKRCPPPGKAGMFGVVMALPQVQAVSGGALEFTLLWELAGSVTGVWGSAVPGGDPVLCTADRVYLGAALVPVPWSTRTAVVGFSPRGNRAVVGSLAGNKLALYNVTDRAEVAFGLAVQEVACYDGRIYVRTQEHVHEVVLTDMGSQVLATSKAVANVMPHATRLYSGVAIQSMLGSCYVSLFTEPGAAQQVRVAELDDYRIVDAKFDHGVMLVLGANRMGKYERLTFRFDRDGSYDVRVVPSSLVGLNFVTLDSGVCACLNEDEKLELFSARKGSMSVKIVEDKALSGDMTLGKHGGVLVAYQGSKVFRLKMK